jgi:ribosomal protein S18 acetylase RimI-like enzyme
MADARSDSGGANTTPAEAGQRPMMSTPVLRRASAADVPLLARMLARAFFDDPVAMWACPPDALRPAALEGFYVARLNQLLAHEEVWTTSELDCAALWAPPERWKTTPREDLELMRGLLAPRVVWRLPMVTLGLLGAERRHPEHPPHWYLAVLATDPPSQGRGLGSSALGPILERCDADGLGAYLESSKERNIHFYARHGFRVTGELRLPLGPTVWLMWRDPQPR